MGDGQHIWASAEWVLMIRNLFVREDGNKLILASGLADSFLNAEETLAWGPAPTEFGTISVELNCKKNQIELSWNGQWHGEAPEIEIRFPGRNSIRPSKNQNSVIVPRSEAV